MPYRNNRAMSDSPKDKFEELFRMQQSLNERIGVRTTGMSEEEQTKWLLNYSRAMSQEMAELIERAVEVVGEVPEVRPAERAGRGGGPVPFPHFHGAGLGHVGRRCLQRLREEE
jgi:hypothetical protein